MDNITLKVKNLTKSYGDLMAVNNINFEIKKGEFFGLLGANGAGKSTTIECILGTKTPDSGSVEVLGLNPQKNRKQLFEKVGVQFQKSSYQEKLKVKEICEVTAALYKKPDDYKKLLNLFSLKKLENRSITELSGGEYQKLAVLLSLIPKPEFLFLDELTTGLDVKCRREVWKHLIRLKGSGITLMLTSHYMDEIQTLCDRICILREGRIMALGKIQEVINMTPYSTLEDAYLYFTGGDDILEGL
ncbi:ABC transporter ATP-binding protein [Oceanirhabdus sp. W0125-5]|uniref:ABC transporter ATP-binding protein n=1 Tax=Oceanirhabdus sp. W0125-5 TaxID=2999116 RepID=UPI0022F2C69C|nr:ABC transporter ATP-binding protein [Oceanirhabdus sp. W0125-5]WBW97197.1 ABC transporter ATP-binding protein [Oceanirhabdus sp. W0125-5]